MLRSFWIGVILSIISLQADAVEAVVSHTIFFLPDSLQHTTKPYVEVYWQINPQSLRFLKTPQHTWQTNIRTDIFFRNDAGIVKEDHYLLETIPADSPVMAFTQTIIDMKKCMVPGGHIKMQLILTDMNDSTKRFVYNDSITVANTGKTYFSEIELLDTFYSSDQHTMFFKNNMQLVPLCAAFYDEKRNTLHYYGELYEANTIEKELRPFLLNIFISKRENEGPVQNLNKTDSVLYVQTQPITGSFSMPSLPSGNYYINFSLANRDKIVVASKTLFFQRYNTKKADSVKTISAKSDTAFQTVHVLDLHKTFVMKFDLPELKAILKMLLPVANPIEVQTIQGFLKNPDDGYMRYFIYNHFAAINAKDPKQAWEDYSARVVAVNKLFDAGNTMGYETDRGYIYLKYGKPDETLTVENERGALPYEIWQYNNIEDKYKNAVFLFYRSTDMISGFILLHTTIPGELRNANWRGLLYSGGNEDPNSRAEQYLGNR